MNGRLIELAARDEDVLNALTRLQNGTTEDKSLSRHPEFAGYKQHTGMLLPALRFIGNSALRTRVDYEGSPWNTTRSWWRIKFEDWSVAIEVSEM